MLTPAAAVGKPPFAKQPLPQIASTPGRTGLLLRARDAAPQTRRAPAVSLRPRAGVNQSPPVRPALPSVALPGTGMSTNEAIRPRVDGHTRSSPPPGPHDGAPLEAPRDPGTHGAGLGLASSAAFSNRRVAETWLRADLEKITSLALIANSQATLPGGATKALELYFRALELFDALDPTQPMAVAVQPEMQKIRDLVAGLQTAAVNASSVRSDRQEQQPAQAPTPLDPEAAMDQRTEEPPCNARGSAQETTGAQSFDPLAPENSRKRRPHGSQRRRFRQSLALTSQRPPHRPLTLPKWIRRLRRSASSHRRGKSTC